MIKATFGVNGYTSISDKTFVESNANDLFEEKFKDTLKDIDYGIKTYKLNKSFPVKEGSIFIKEVTIFINWVHFWITGAGDLDFNVECLCEPNYEIDNVKDGDNAFFDALTENWEITDEILEEFKDDYIEWLNSQFSFTYPININSNSFDDITLTSEGFFGKLCPSVGNFAGHYMSSSQFQIEKFAINDLRVG